MLFGTKIKSANINDVNFAKNNVIDVRSLGERNVKAPKNTTHVMMDLLLSNPEQYLQKDKHYYIMCQSGMRSKKVVKVLTKLNYDVTNLQGGLMSYKGK